ncbi:FAD-dependent monooxygenase [Kitasatospora sp. NBC_00240]|uniref:FAD-dependent monooxygenase n=1 Tax=Kitasatospora sp. NBC_00240 TaxID=2903567 RepID=UPI0022535C26|nr:FAD-dependent monooxygenase [Kitasatospora sp. NBC_00240]MCX5209890.1 FAD-dependent monooxygenase [Kitasatospora sp. NBC_00240]
MTPRSVLISGAGVAGPTLAYWLARQGLRPTVVEKAANPRSSGNPVDVRGAALPVVEAMGVLPHLRAAATSATTMRLLNASGRTIARLPLPGGRAGGERREVEVPRGDLAAVLRQAARSDTEFLLGDSIAALQQDEHGVDVTFERAAPRRFDLVVGADGLHSQVRRLAFGPERGFVRPTGILVATLPLGEPADHPHEVQLLNAPGRLVSVHPSRGAALAAFIFRRPDITAFDHHDTGLHRRIVTESHTGLGWRVPGLLDQVANTDELYFDAVSTVDLPAWSRGRITLLGDAASCVSLLGDGSSLAIAGARTLAAALAEHPAAPAAALARYEAEHRARVTPKQRGIKRSAALLVPATRFGLGARNLAARLRSAGRS